MYNNIGKKIKTFVTCLVIVSSIMYIIGGMYLIFAEKSGTATRIIGLLIAIIGPLTCWISGFVTYGFGEIVEKVNSIEAYIKQPENELKDLVEKQLEEGMEEEAPYYSPENYQVDNI